VAQDQREGSSDSFGPGRHTGCWTYPSASNLNGQASKADNVIGYLCGSVLGWRCLCWNQAVTSIMAEQQPPWAVSLRVAYRCLFIDTFFVQFFAGPQRATQVGRGASSSSGGTGRPLPSR
jgi:hypothetical protein